MLKQIKRLNKITALVLLLVTSSYYSFSQDAYMNMLDTSKSALFQNFVGIKLFMTDISATSLNQDLQFQYVSNNLGNVFKFQHDMNVSNLSNFFNIGLGMDENLGKHLSINFFNTSLGYMQNMWDWSAGVGAGYFISLNKKQTMRLNATMNVYFESITYTFGSYYDSTQLGFLVDGVNVGSAVKSVKYVNDIWSLTPGLEFIYRCPSIDFFAGAYYNYVFSYHEKVNFSVHSISVSDAIYYQNETPVSRDVVNLGKYIIQIGIIREFGI